MRSRPVLLLEFFLLCIIVPGIIIFGRHAPYMFAFLWGATAYCYFIMRFLYHDHLREIWKWSAVTWPNLKPLLLRWAIASIAMLLFIWWYDPERMFNLLKHNPSFVPKVLILYPVLSALPQEFIFCSFFFQRYEPVFGRSVKMVLASAVAFAYAHILYINPVAPSLSLIGGLVFAHTYLKHKSLALVTIEHGLYGNTLFLTGLGWYFYSGAVPTT